jgi:hypothetical protein
MFGSDPVEISQLVPGDDKDGWGTPDDEIEWEPLAGCRFRPLSTKETIELFEKATEAWKLTSPPHALLLQATASSLIRHKGRIYEMDGAPRPFTDASGANFKVTVICKRQQAETS